MKLPMLALVSLAACASDGTATFDDTAADVEGIYRVDSYTRNDSACEPGGESVLGSDGFAAAFRTQFGSVQLLEVISCASVADCRDKVAIAKARTDGYPIEFSFTVQATDGDALIGQGASTGFWDGDALCTEAEVTRTALTLDAATLRIEQSITVADDFPSDGDSCSTTDARAAAAGNACSAMELLTATRVDAL